MSAEEVLAEYRRLPTWCKVCDPKYDEREFAYCEHFEQWLRHALAAHTAWLLERTVVRIQGETMAPKIFGRPDFTDGIAAGKLQAADYCRTVLQQEIIDLTK